MMVLCTVVDIPLNDIIIIMQQAVYISICCLCECDQAKARDNRASLRMQKAQKVSIVASVLSMFIVTCFCVMQKLCSEFLQYFFSHYF